MRRTVHPSRPSANTCCRFSSFKTLAIPAENHTGSPTVNVPSVSPPYGRFSGVHIWPVLGVHRGGEFGPADFFEISYAITVRFRSHRRPEPTPPTRAAFVCVSVVVYENS